MLLPEGRSASDEAQAGSGSRKTEEDQAAHVMSKLKASMSRIQPAKSLRTIFISMPVARSAAEKGARNLSSVASRERKAKETGWPFFVRSAVAGAAVQPAASSRRAAATGS